MSSSQRKKSELRAPSGREIFLLGTSDLTEVRIFQFRGYALYPFLLVIPGTGTAVA